MIQAFSQNRNIGQIVGLIVDSGIKKKVTLRVVINDFPRHFK